MHVVDHPFVYEAVVRLPRNRHPRPVLLEETVPVDVRGVGDDEAPVALRAPESLRGAPERVDHRAFEGSFYVPLRDADIEAVAGSVGMKASAALVSTWTAEELDRFASEDVRSVDWTDRERLLPLFVDACSVSLLSVGGVLHRRVEPPVATRTHQSQFDRVLPACAWHLAVDGFVRNADPDGRKDATPEILLRHAYPDASSDGLPIVEIVRPDLVAFDPDPFVAAALARTALDMPETNGMGRTVDRGGAFAPAARLEEALASGAGVDEIMALVSAVWRWRCKYQTQNQTRMEREVVDVFRRRRHAPDPRVVVPLPGDPGPSFARMRFQVENGEFRDRHLVEADVPASDARDVAVVARVSFGEASACVLHDGASFLVPFVPSGEWGGEAFHGSDPPEAAGLWNVRARSVGGASDGGPGLDAVADAARRGAAAGLLLVDEVVHLRVHEPLLSISPAGCSVVVDPLWDREGRPANRARRPSDSAVLPLTEASLAAAIAVAFDVAVRDVVLPDVVVGRGGHVGALALRETGSKLLRRCIAGFRTRVFSERSRGALAAFAAKDALPPADRSAALVDAVRALACDPAAGLVVRQPAFGLLSAEIAPRLASHGAADPVLDDEDGPAYGIGL